MDIWRTRMVPSRSFLWVGIKDSPPYLHDGRLLTLEDSVEFIILVLGTQLTAKRTEPGGLSTRALTVMIERHEKVLATGGRTQSLCGDRLKNRRNIGGVT